MLQDFRELCTSSNVKELSDLVGAQATIEDWILSIGKVVELTGSHAKTSKTSLTHKTEN